MTTRSKAEREALTQAQAMARARTHRNRRRIQLGAWASALVLIAAVVTVGLLTSRPDASASQRTAPAFTLPTTAGTSVSLSDFSGQPVILYFNEGAGCGSCSMQLAAIEKDPGFADAGITILPIVMNTRDQIQPDLDQYGVTSPVLLDDGTVSKAYDTLGKGMHEGLPGHSFVLIGPDGTQLWNGEYPSMWLEPQKLLDEVTARLAA
ncbi:peroxiredoxin family protein [Pengzhenrongella frigida]|uniref:Peroxiredoxin family protein n=1 Tax=Pengzhenrongella frigida TaxID=1259133 RepID=A0A4Q5MV72_9MICO|nr:peroxiredoxin family protein [Cellulomonas sp. HLT2-17]RYV49482.1 peroxiredoxin family protein [Cellulomonas sp. HLT2-17]